MSGIRLPARDFNDLPTRSRLTIDVTRVRPRCSRVLSATQHSRGSCARPRLGDLPPTRDRSPFRRRARRRATPDHSFDLRRCRLRRASTLPSDWSLPRRCSSTAPAQCARGPPGCWRRLPIHCAARTSGAHSTRQPRSSWQASATTPINRALALCSACFSCSAVDSIRRKRSFVRPCGSNRKWQRRSAALPRFRRRGREPRRRVGNGPEPIDLRYEPSAVTGPGLVRVIGRWTLVAAIINGVVGSGIFGLPAALAGFAGEWSPVAVLVAGCGILVIVLCFAEVGSRFDAGGGPYLYSRSAFGPAVGFQVGWMHVFTRLLSAAAVVNVLVAYLAKLAPWVGTQTGRAFTIIAAVTVVTIINVVGVKQAAWTVNLFTVAKLLPLAAVIVIGVFYLSPTVFATQTVEKLRWADAVLLLVFAYGGFESAIVAAGETKDPKRDTAFALLIAMSGITILYFLVQLVVVGVLPNAASSTAPFADTMRAL